MHGTQIRSLALELFCVVLFYLFTCVVAKYSFGKRRDHPVDAMILTLLCWMAVRQPLMQMQLINVITGK